MHGCLAVAPIVLAAHMLQCCFFQMTPSHSVIGIVLHVLSQVWDSGENPLCVTGIGIVGAHVCLSRMLLSPCDSLVSPSFQCGLSQCDLALGILHLWWSLMTRTSLASMSRWSWQWDSCNLDLGIGCSCCWHRQSRHPLRRWCWLERTWAHSIARAWAEEHLIGFGHFHFGEFPLFETHHQSRVWAHCWRSTGCWLVLGELVRDEIPQLLDLGFLTAHLAHQLVDGQHLRLLHLHLGFHRLGHREEHEEQNSEALHHFFAQIAKGFEDFLAIRHDLSRSRESNLEADRSDHLKLQRLLHSNAHCFGTGRQCQSWTIHLSFLWEAKIFAKSRENRYS